MRSKRYTVEQIVAKLREAEKLQAQGLTIPQACKRLGISDQTFYRWRLKYGALKEDEAQRLKALEQENARLKKIVAEQALDISLLKDLIGADHLLFGSDWPHAEGLAEPTSFIDDIPGFTPDEVRLIMHDNASALVTPRR